MKSLQNLVAISFLIYGTSQMKLKWLSEDIADENGTLDLVAISKKTRINNPTLDDDELPAAQRQKTDDFVGKYSFS